MNRFKWMMFALVCLLAACGDSDPSTDIQTVDTDVEVDGKADGVGTWHARTDGMTMWLSTVLEPTSATDEPRWVVQGRVSKTLTGVRAYTASGHHFDARMVSPRKFTVTLDRDETLDVVSGERVYFDFFAKRGRDPMLHGMARFATRVTDWAGNSGVFVFRAVNPVIVGADLKFRGRASTKSGFELDFVDAEGSADPALFDDGPKKYHFDWTPAGLLAAASPQASPVRFVGQDAASTPIEKTASLQFRLIQMGLGTKAPFEAWPPPRCGAEVRACLDTLDGADTEDCGWANEVESCGGLVTLPLGADAARFAADLRVEVADWYEIHATDVQMSNGPSLDDVLAAIDVGQVYEVSGDEVDRLGYHPDHFAVFAHPDPVFSGSGRVWYGVYDHGGTLLHVAVAD